MSRLIGNGLLLPAGTASAAPLALQSGTNLTTPAAGAVEYDGRVIYATVSSAAGRGVSPAINIYRLNTDLTGNQSTSAQKALGVGLTVAASTIYAFEGVFVVTKSAGTNSHNFTFSLGGTATTNNTFQVTVVSGGTSTSAFILGSTSGTSFAFTSVTSASVTFSFVVKGTISINASGTLLPQYVLSADPGGAYTVRTGSYFTAWPIGVAGSATSVGAWA